MVGEDPRKRIEKLWKSMPNRIIDTRRWYPKYQHSYPSSSLYRGWQAGGVGERGAEPANRIIKGL